MIQYVGGEGEQQNNSMNNPGASHLCFDMPDFEGTLTILKSKGITPIGPPLTVEEGPNKGK